MKNFALLLTFLISVFSFSQNETFTISGTRQHWSGGICCITGVDYSLQITSENFDLIGLKIDSIYLDRNIFYNNLQIRKTNKSVFINFGSRFDQSIKNEISTPILIGKDSNSIVFELNKKRFEIQIKELKELEYLAYP